MRKRFISLLLCVVMVLNGALSSAAMNAFADETSTQVTNLSATRTQAIHKEAFEYVLFTGSRTTDLEMNADMLKINGDLHSNKDFIYRGSEIILNGTGEASGQTVISVSDPDYMSKIGFLQEDVSEVNLVDYSSEIEAYLRTKEIPIFEGDTDINGDEIIMEEGLIVEGSIGFHTSAITGSSIIVAKDNINYSVGGLSAEGEGKLVLCAKDGDININASNSTINGIIYAPNGTVTITGSNVVMNGRIIADQFNFWGSNLTINGGSGDLDIIDFLFLPDIRITEEGEHKENRKVILDISRTPRIEKVIKEATQWEFAVIGENGERPAIEGDDYAIDDNSSDSFTKNLIFKKAGTYEVEVTVYTNTSSKSTSLELIILEDVAPIADFTVGDYYYRDPEAGNQAAAELIDMSYSTDKDEIGQRIWTIYFDSDNDGSFEDEQGEDVSIGNDTKFSFYTDRVGSYQVELTAVESFHNTISHLITEADYRSDNTVDKSVETKSFIVGNVKPEASVEVAISKDVDLVFTVGSSDTDIINTYAEKINDIKGTLEEQGYQVNLSTITTSKLTAQDTFAWTEYDHYNYVDRYLPTLTKHIIYEGNHIKMLGYSYAPLKDFLLVEDENDSQKIFSFDIQRDGTDWHSMEGGGFLFNSSIRDNKLYGFCILITQSGLKLVQITGVDLNSFRNGNYSMVQSAGKLLRTFPFSNLYAEHHLKIVADSQSISLWDGTLQVIDNYKLPENDYGYGYGPIISHGSHACGQQSYFTFANILMETISGEKLADVLENFEWTSNTSRYVVNLSDSSMDDFQSDEELAAVAKQILEHNISFIGIGNSVNSQQYTDIINAAAGKGLYVSSEDVETSAVNMQNYILSSENSKDFTIDQYVTVDQRIDYINSYSDYEKDPRYDQMWEYEYDPTVFYNKQGNTEIQTFTSDKPVKDFAEAGAYSIRLKVRDNPVGENDAFDEYRLWSDESIFQKVLMVHNRPVVELDATVYKENSGDSQCYVNIIDNCYDLDHLNEKGKGITSKNYQWKKLHDAQWTPGRLSNKIDAGEIYIVSLIATDEEGNDSYPAIRIISTHDFVIPGVEEDLIPPTIYIELDKMVANAGEEVKIVGYATDNMGVESFELYINNELALLQPGRVFYTGSSNETVLITAKAVDIYGNEATTSKELIIKDTSDRIPPIARIEAPQNEAVMDFAVQIIGTVTDESVFKRYRLEYREKEKENFLIISEGEAEVISGILGEWSVLGLRAGFYEVRLTAEDGAGNTSYVTYEYRLLPSEEGGILNPEPVDVTAPKIELSLVEQAKVGEEVNALINVEDDEGVQSVQVFMDDVLVLESPGQITFSKAEACAVKIKVYASDRNGNVAIKWLLLHLLQHRTRVRPLVVK